jgi:hypothetical protein
VLLLSGLAAQAAGQPNALLTTCVTGQIDAGSFEPDKLIVKVEGTGEWAYVSSAGHFQLCGIDAGRHDLRVTTMDGQVIWQESVYIVPGGAPVAIELPGRRSGSKGSATVSVHRLQHKPPRKAVREFHRSLAVRDTDLAQSVQHLLRAVEIDPGFLEAQNNLGCAYIRLGRHEEALRCLTRAAALDPAEATVFSNLAIALLRTGRYGDAEQAARRALRLGAAASSVNYLLGASLAMQRKYTRETLNNLRQAAGAIPAAHLLAGKVLLGLGNEDDAANEFRAYLDSGAPASREQVQDWLAALERRAETRQGARP